MFCFRMMKSETRLPRRAGPHWRLKALQRSACCSFWTRRGARLDPQDPRRLTLSTPLWSRRCASAGSTSAIACHDITMTPTSGGRTDVVVTMDVAMPARSFLASDTLIGSSTTPAGQSLEAVRRIRDLIEARTQELAAMAA